MFELIGITVPAYLKEEADLIEIEKLLQKNGKSLANYTPMPLPRDAPIYDVTDHLILQELNLNKDLCAMEAGAMKQQLTHEQLHIFESIISTVDSETGGFFFVYGFGGTGKTFLSNVLTLAVRGKAKIVINVASSGIAAILLPSGRTTHSRFVIPIEITEDSTCGIYPITSLANLLKATSLIIWDEAPMTQQLCFEAFDRTMRDIMKKDLPFGGKCVVLGGDFRQILPVIPGGDRAMIVNASVNSSNL